MKYIYLLVFVLCLWVSSVQSKYSKEHQKKLLSNDKKEEKTKLVEDSGPIIFKEDGPEALEEAAKDEKKLDKKSNKYIDEEEMSATSLAAVFLNQFYHESDPTNLEEDGSGTSNGELSGLVPENYTAATSQNAKNMTDYRPSDIVVFFHNMWHFPSVKGKPDGVFTSGAAPGADDYYASLTGLPITMFCLGIAMMIVVLLMILGVFDDIKGCPDRAPKRLGSDATEEEVEAWTKKVEEGRQTWVIIFLVSIFVGIFGNHIMFYGDDLYNRGFDTLTGALTTIQNSIKSVRIDSDTIADAFAEVEVLSAKAITNCPAMSTDEMKALIANEYQALDDMSFKTEVIYEAVTEANIQLQKYGSKKDIVVYLFYAVSICLLGAMFGCYFTKQSFIMKVCIFVAQFVMIGLIGMASLELMFMIGLGDFCMDPTKSVVDSLTPGTDLWRTAKYYALCGAMVGGDGDNLIHEGLYIAYEMRRQLGLAIQSLYMPVAAWNEVHPGVSRPAGPTCGVYSIDHDVEDAFYALQALAPQFQNIAAQIQCGHLHVLWRVAFEVAACSDTMAGIFSLWWSQLICMVGLFATIISSSWLMLYFDDLWEVGNNVFKIPEEVGLLKKDDDADAATEASDTAGTQV